MKKLCIPCLFVLTIAMHSLLPAQLSAQKTVSSGKITYKIADLTVHNKEDLSEMQAEMMKNMKWTMYFTPKKVRVDIRGMMGGLISTSMIYGLKDSTIVIMMSMMGQKMKMTMPIQKAQEEGMLSQSLNPEEYEVIPHPEKTKQILGYDTYLVELIKRDSQGNDEMKSYIYLTKDIAPSAAFHPEFRKLQLKGFPLEYRIYSPGQGVVTFIAEELSTEPVEEKVFAIPDDYVEIDPNDFMQSMPNQQR